MASSTSPTLMPARAATDPSATLGTAAPGEGSRAAMPTVDACTSRTAAAATRFAATPAEITAARSSRGRFFSRSGSSGEILGREGSLAGRCCCFRYSFPAAAAAFSLRSSASSSSSSSSGKAT